MKKPPPSPREPNNPRTANRLDQALVAAGLCQSREQAQRLILAGSVTINNQTADKPGRRVSPQDLLAVAAPPRYVSRGGTKLEHGLAAFRIQVQDRVAVDLGASTGGFTDCLLQHGAAKVYAVDVGRGQLAWKLRQHPSVVVMEGVNARHLTPDNFPAPFAQPTLVTIDCSFISLRKILPSAVELLQPSGIILALIKPQFEAGRAEAARGEGVITDPAVHRRVLDELERFVSDLAGCQWLGVVESPLLGPAGNKEFLACIEKTS